MEVKSNDLFFRIWAGVGLIAFFIIWNLPWRFQVNDDLLMMWLVSGAYTGTPESYAVFIHPLLSWGFSKAYSIAPDIHWYSLTWYSVLFLSYFLILKKVERIDSNLLWKHLFSGFILILVIHFCFFLQFTIVAGFASLAGLLILDRNKDFYSKPVIILGWILIFFSLMVRWESMVLIGLGFFLFNVLYISKPEFKSAFRMFSLLAIVFGLAIGSKYYWEINSEYSEFLAFNKARAAVIDHPVFYERIKSGKIEEGSSMFYFARWMFEDEKISISELEVQKQELDADLFSFKQVVNSFERFVSVQKMEAFKSSLSILLVLISLIYCRSKKRILAFLGLWLLFMLFASHFFILNGRVTILFFLVFLFPILNSSKFPHHRLSIFVGAYIILLGLFAYHFFNFMEEARGREIMHQEFESLRKRIPEKEVILLEGYMEHNFYFDYSVRNQVPILSLGWISRSPFQKKAMAKFGLSGLVDAENYWLFGIRQQRESLYFPEYMNSISGPFELRQGIESPNFVLLRFSKK